MEGEDFTIEFQSTPPRRRRLNLASAGAMSLEISIHASEKEATIISS